MSENQINQLVRLLRHAATTTPYYRDAPWAAALRAGRDIRFRDIPVTPKSEVRRDPGRFYSRRVPETEGVVGERVTSGTTGELLKVLRTQRQMHWNWRENQRLRRGWGYAEAEPSLTLRIPGSDHPSGTITVRNGTQHDLYCQDPHQIVQAIRRIGAHCVQATPSQAISFLEIDPPLEGLKLLSTVAEIVPPELAAQLARIPGCRHQDSYGCVEAGILAASCARCGQYHLAEGHVIVEILDDDGNPAKRGEMGRVVVTPLFGLAMSLLRYEIGDFAMVSGQTDCPEGRRALSRIVGRERNLFILPDGTRMAPRLGTAELDELGIRRHKMIQTTSEDVRFLYVPATPGSVIDPGRLEALVHSQMSPLFRVWPEPVEAIPPSASGKNLMHESLVTFP